LAHSEGVEPPTS